MESIPCDVVLLPSDELAEKAIAASRLLAAHDAFFTLEIGKFFPHASLYMFQLTISDIPKVENILTEIAHDYSPLEAHATEYQLGEGFAVGYVDPSYEITDELRAIQTRVIDAINPLRAGMREKDIAKMKDATGLKLENLQKYGYIAVGELFRPHLTISRLKEHKPEVLELLPDITTFNGTFTKLGLFEMGDNGTCVREIKTFDLTS